MNTHKYTVNIHSHVCLHVHCKQKYNNNECHTWSTKNKVIQVLLKRHSSLATGARICGINCILTQRWNSCILWSLIISVLWRVKSLSETISLPPSLRLICAWFVHPSVCSIRCYGSDGSGQKLIGRDSLRSAEVVPVLLWRHSSCFQGVQSACVTFNCSYWARNPGPSEL